MSYAAFGQPTATIMRPSQMTLAPISQSAPKVEQFIASLTPVGPAPATSPSGTTPMLAAQQDGGGIVFAGIGVMALALGGAVYWKYFRKKGA